MRLYIEFNVSVQAKTRLDAFWKGVSRFVAPSTLAALFDIEELPTLISGQRALNFEELKQYTRYGNGFTPEHRMI